jgi:nucleoside-diphosphate-sugar epimerase
MPSNINPRIVITGANGFIGNYLLHFLSKAGCPILALVRSVPAVNLDNVSYALFDLNSGLADPDVLKKDDVLIHCAYSKTARVEDDINTLGLKSLINLANKVGVKKHIFFSSISAKPVTSSYYGRHKYASTLLFNEHDVILTTGLVVGNGGVFANTLAFIKKTGLIPTIKKGKQPIYFVGIHEVAEAVDKVIKEDRSGNFLLANPAPANYIDFYKAAASFQQVKSRQLNVPISLMKLIIYLNSFLKNPFVTRENLKGLIELDLLNNTAGIQTEIIPFDNLEQVFQKSL